MAKKKKSVSKKPIEQYEHKDKKRLNNPPVGLVTPQTDKDGKKKKYQYDPHLDPQLQWAGKAEHTSFEVPTVSLHVHERIDPKTIIETAKKEKKGPFQLSLFAQQEKPLREAIEFYKHKEGWTNRLIAGDSLLVMNSLLEKEGMGGKVQMIYFDPPYGIKYGSNFQPFVNKRDVKDGKDEDLTVEPEMIKAFRDTWELKIHSYLTYLRDRLLLAKEMLHESGSIFVQISDENLHLVRSILDEVFGVENFVSLITFRKTGSKGSAYLDTVCDYVLFYAKSRQHLKYYQLYVKEEFNPIIHASYSHLMEKNGKIRSMTLEEKTLKTKIPKDSRPFQTVSITSQDPNEKTKVPVVVDGTQYYCPVNRHWSVDPELIPTAVKKGYVKPFGNTLRRLSFYDEEPGRLVTNIWDDLMGSDDPIYVVQTTTKAIQRCLIMSTDPGDLVLDPTCGSGTTTYVAEQWGRRWITCDTSRVAITLAKQRLMTANFDYYQLAHTEEGIGSGLKYKTVPHITLKSIANNEPPADETLFDQPLIDIKKARITGPFTVEAVPSPVTKSLEDIESEKPASDESIIHSGETLRQNEWREELLRTGVRAKGGKMIEFSRVELLPGTRFLHAEAETREDTPKKVLVSFGPEHAPLEQRQVEEAWQEARQFRPDILLFAAFQFDEEASKDIDEMKPETTGMQFLKAQMNADLLTDDLKKKRSSNESFWLVGQPDIQVKEIKKGEDKRKMQIEVLGFDYYNPITGDVESGGKNNIAMWMLDTDYNNRSLFPSQVFFPMAGEKEGWAKLAKNLKAEIDEEKIESFKGTVSLPFKKPESCQVAVKIIDDRGIECLKIVRL
ncbi:MAG: site-specific DNA-methyltransferase [Candidatus Scalinduaceae bacterium]